MWESLRTDPSVDNARSAMAENYRQMPGALMPHVPALAGALLGGEVPMMVHCTAGKDRTGVLAALILLVLGVSREDVYAELSEVVAGRKKGREREDEVIIFDSTGMALQDVAAAAIVYDRAVSDGRGTPFEFAAF